MSMGLTGSCPPSPHICDESEDFTENFIPLSLKNFPRHWVGYKRTIGGKNIPRGDKFGND
jgi:hypothetical protein